MHPSKTVCKLCILYELFLAKMRLVGFLFEDFIGLKMLKHAATDQTDNFSKFPPQKRYSLVYEAYTYMDTFLIIM